MKLIVMCCLILVFLNGCGTLATRFAFNDELKRNTGYVNSYNPYPYPATKFDYGLSKECFTRPDANKLGGISCLVFMPLMIADFAISITFDTVLLPIDLATAASLNERIKERESLIKKNESLLRDSRKRQ